MSFRTSNNEAEYEALIAGLKAAKKLDAEEVEIFLDSCLVVSQVERSFEARDPLIAEYLKLVGTLLAGFQGVSNFKGTEQSCRFFGHSGFILRRLCSLYNFDRGAEPAEHRTSAMYIRSINTQLELDGSYCIIYNK